MRLLEMEVEVEVGQQLWDTEGLQAEIGFRAWRRRAATSCTSIRGLAVLCSCPAAGTTP